MAFLCLPSTLSIDGIVFKIWNLRGMVPEQAQHHFLLTQAPGGTTWGTILGTGDTFSEAITDICHSLSQAGITKNIVEKFDGICAEIEDSEAHSPECTRENCPVNYYVLVAFKSGYLTPESA